MSKLRKTENALLFLTLLFLPTQLGRHFWPDFSFIYSLKIDYLSPTIYFWDILIVVLVTVWLIQRPKINKLALNLLLLFLFTQAVSLFGSANVGAGLARLEQYIIAGFFGIYLASLKNTKVIYLPLLLGVVGESLIAILQFLKGSTLGLWILGERSFGITTPGIAKFDFYGLEFLRPYGTFPHPNVLAGYLLISTVVLKSLSVIARKESSTDVAIHRTGKIASPLRGLAMTVQKASVFFVGFTVFLTMSRTAISAGFVLLLLSFRKKSITFITIIIFIIIILSPILFTRFSSLLSFDNLTLIRREELIGNSWQIFSKSPVFGVGLNNFITNQASTLAIGPSRFLQPVHNIFLLALSETGIIGLLGLLVLLYPLRFTLAPLVLIIFLGMFDHYFLTLPQGYRLLFLVWGLSMSAKILK